MGGGGSKIPTSPPTVVQEPYPSQGGGQINVYPEGSRSCPSCDLTINTNVSTSSLKLTRDVSFVSVQQCQRYDVDLAAVRKGEMSFQDFLLNLQNEVYFRPASQRLQTEGGQSFCAQVRFSDEDASKIGSIADFDSNIGKLKTLRVRQVSDGFSSETKARFQLSLPVNFSYVSAVSSAGGGARTDWRQIRGRWVPVTIPSPSKPIVTTKTSMVKSILLFHPCPVRIANTQYDAVLSLNDPADPTIDAVVLIPIKASNTGSKSELFFSKFVKHVTTIAFPSDSTGLYPSSDIATGKDWNLKDVFCIDENTKSPMVSVQDGFYSWEAAGGYTRVLKTVNGRPADPKQEAELLKPSIIGSSVTLVYGWKSTGRTVRYFMLNDPVEMSTSDLGILTRNLPPTPVDQAIHPIPVNTTILFKSPNRVACTLRKSGCPVRERMENPTSEALTALFGVGEGSVTDMLKRPPDSESCDPFAQNASRTMVDQAFTPARALTFLFNFGLVVGLLFGIWLAMYLVTKDYDFGYRDFSEQVGKVMGTLAKQASGRTNAPSAPAAPAPAAPALNLGALAKSLPLPKKVQALAAAAQ